MINKFLTSNFSFLEEVLDNVSDSYKKCFENIIDNILKIESEVKSKKINAPNIEYYAKKCLQQILFLLSKTNFDLNDLIENTKIYFNSHNKLKIIENYFWIILNSNISKYEVIEKNGTNDEIDGKNFEKFYEIDSFIFYLRKIIIWFSEICLDKDVKIDFNYYECDIYNFQIKQKSIISEKEKKEQKNEIGSSYKFLSCDTTTPASLLLKENRTFYVPIYQRGYNWTIKNVEAFLDDIRKRTIDNNFHYLGIVVFKLDNNRLKIIDGQQRLTTSLLLIKAIRYIVSKNNLQYNNTDLKWFFDEKIDLTNIILNPMAQSRNNDVFRKILDNFNIDALKDNFENHDSQLYKNYMCIYNYLNEKLDMQNLNSNKLSFFKFCEKFIFDFRLILVELDHKKINNKQELEIFENVNSKGKGLQIEDLIKNSIINNCNEDVLAVANSTYSNADIIYNSEIDNEQTRDYLNKFFKYFTEYFHDDGKEIDFEEKNKSEALVKFRESYDNFLLSENIKKVDDGFNIDSYKYSINALKTYLDLYISIDNLDKKFFEKETILMSGVLASKRNLYVPLIFFIFEKLVYPKNKRKDSDIKLVFEKNHKIIYQSFFELTKFIVSTFIVGGRGQSDTRREVIKFFSNLRKDIDNFDFKKLPSSIKKELFEKKFSKNDFKEKVATLSYAKDKWVIKLLFIMVEYLKSNVENGCSLPFSDYKKITIEHIMPQVLTEDWKNDLNKWDSSLDSKAIDENHEIYLNKIGNLFILGANKNGSIKNKNFVEKMKSYQKDVNTHLFRQSDIHNIYDLGFSKNEKWDFEDIRKRTDKINTYIVDELFK